MAQIIEIDEQITVSALAELLNLPVSKLIAELFKNGVMSTVNEKIDFDTAVILVAELEPDVELTKKDRSQMPARIKREISKTAKARPPVIAVMGHVDHGKTSLLDAIREAETAKGEAGGITQHLSAYQVVHKDRPLTFIDTPGHEAFAALREHGARLTDLVILVIAADDGVKPQTIEAIRFAKQAGVKVIVAANKIDKTGADINRLKQQLSENQLMPEDWGGDTIILPVSAKTKEGLAELLDMVVLVADVEELKAETEGPAEGIIIEAHMEQGKGRLATALVEHGTLKKGDFVVVGSTYAKVRTLQKPTGELIDNAGPSTPVVMAGLKELPDFADEFKVVKTEKEARAQSGQTSQDRKLGDGGAATTSGELLRIINRAEKLSDFKIVVKADVQGSLTSVIDSLKTLDTEEVAVTVVSSGVGVITENDLHSAATSGAVIYGFHTTLPASLKNLALRDHVSVRLFNVIYELIDDAKKEMEGLLAPEVIEESLGELIVKGVFKIAKTEVICGGEVTKGTLKVAALARVFRDKKKIADDLEVINLKSGPSEVKEVPTGEMCGLSFRSASRVEVQEGDHIELYTRETKIRTL